MSPEPVEQSKPADTGTSTTEFKLAAIAGVVGAVLTGLVATFAALQEAMPDVGWIASGVVILGALAAALAPLLKYIGGRSQVKVALANLEAAKVLVGASPGAVTAAAISDITATLPRPTPSDRPTRP